MAAAAVVAVAAGGLSPVAVSRAAAAGSDGVPSTTIQAPRMKMPRPAGLVTADASGYLSSTEPRVPSGPSAWVSWDGTAKEGFAPAAAYNGGFALERVGISLRNFVIRDYATGRTVQMDIPETDTSTNVFTGDSLLTLRQVDGKWTMHLLQAPDGGGALVDHPVGGVPDDMGPAVYDPVSDSRGAAFWYKPPGGGGTWHTELFDFATLKLTRVPSDGYGVVESRRLSADKAVFMSVDKTFTHNSVYVVDRAHPEKPATVIDSLDGVKDSQTQSATVGDWLVYVSPDDPQHAVRAVPLSGGAPRTLLASSRDLIISSGDGSILVEGGSDAQHWAVRRITPGTDGSPSVAVKRQLPPVSVYEVGGVAVDQSRLLLASEDARATGQYTGTFLVGSTLSRGAGGEPVVPAPDFVSDLGSWYPGDDTGDPGSSGYYVSCYTDCLRLVGTGEGSEAHQNWEGRRVWAASGQYRVVDGAGSDFEVRDGDGRMVTRGDGKTVALWGNTMWTDGATQGTVAATALPSGKPAGTVDVGATCVPNDLQVVDRWIYWSCGPDGDAGVYDTTTEQLIDVPSGYAELADGYLVSQDTAAGKLMITYLPGAVDAGQLGTRELGPLPPPLHTPDDRRDRFWGVDRFGGPVAYLTASGDVTVAWPKVRLSPLGVISSDVPTDVNFGAKGTLKGGWDLSKPAGSWKVTIAKPSGEVVRTFTGGTARGRIGVTWDGTATAGGRPVPAGTYTWKVTAYAADNPAQSATTSGTVTTKNVVPRGYGTK